MEEKKEIYFRRLDIVRILSCILVLFYHLNILKGGFLAVCTFFALSGYLTCISALKNENFSIKLYYKNRIKKLYIPLIIVVFITVILAIINSNINWINLKQETFSVIFGYNNIWQLNANKDYFTRNINSPFIHLWYISILLQFDLIFPFVFTLFKKIENKIKNNFSVIAVTIFTIFTTILFYYMSNNLDFMMAYYNSFARSFSVLFGILLAIIHYKYNIKFSRIFKKYNIVIFVIYIIALTGFCIFLPNNIKYYAIFMILTTILSCRLIEYSTIESNKPYKFDKHLKTLSKMSYEVYLVQYPVIFFMHNISINDNLKDISIIILTFLISFILYLLLNISAKDKTLKYIKRIVLAVIIILGSFIVITAKDYTGEMKELENRLKENSKFIEEKNNEYLNNENVENKENTITSNISDNKVWNIVSESTQNKEINATTKNVEVKDKKNTNISKKREENKSNTKTEEKDKKKSTTQSKKNKESNIDEKIRTLLVVGVGDSVLLDATKEFYNKFPNGYFDGKISRTVSGAKDVLINLKNKGKLGNTIILCLATNGDYSDKHNRELMKILGNRKVYWVNAVGADDPKFNDNFKSFAKNYPNIHIVEWDKVAKNHPEYLEPDKIHPNYRGGKFMVKLIYDTIYHDYLEESKNK